MSVVIVYVHGLWLRGHEGVVLQSRLARALDAQTRVFAYPSVRNDLTANARALQAYLGAIRADTLHLVAHSLGGLVILRLFELLAAADAVSASNAALPAGHIVLMGSPVQGSRSAQRFARLPYGKFLLGASGMALLETPGRRWAGARPLGIIAGDRALGLGRLLGPMGAPNDGTVWVTETVLPGAQQQIALRVGHAGMPFSHEVADQTAAFLRTGRFIPRV